MPSDRLHGWPGHRSHTDWHHPPFPLCVRKVPPEQADAAIAELEAVRTARREARAAAQAGCTGRIVVTPEIVLLPVEDWMMRIELVDPVAADTVVEVMLADPELDLERCLDRRGLGECFGPFDEDGLTAPWSGTPVRDFEYLLRATQYLVAVYRVGDGRCVALGDLRVAVR